MSDKYKERLETVTPVTDQIADDADIINFDISGNFNDAVSGNVITYSASGLPAGLAIDLNTGVISGTIDKSASQFAGNGEHAVINGRVFDHSTECITAAIGCDLRACTLI